MKYLTAIFFFLVFLLFGFRSFGESSEHICHKDNYKDYIFDAEKTRELIRTTGKGCFLERANFWGADLSGAYLSRAVLTRAILSEANLRGAILSGADLRGADLREVFWTEVDLSGANLSAVDLFGANLSGVRLRGADLTGAVLVKAILTGADLSGAVLIRAYLEGADLRDADLEEAVLTGARYDLKTDFPGFDLAFVIGKGMNYVGGGLWMDSPEEDVFRGRITRDYP